MVYRVPFVDPRAHYQSLKQEIDDAIIGCLTRGDLICRQQLFDFEAHLAAFVGVKYAVGLNSGYHALHFALLAAGIGPGDEVITVAHSFVATVSAIVHTGATPVLIDVGDDFNMDPDLLAAALTPRTKALLPVHLNGRVCQMDRIMAFASQHGLKVIEDAAQSLGASIDGQRAGAIGDAGCFSFYPFKVLGGFGDGGALTTNDPDLARLARRLRYNGEDRETGEYHMHGQTALLDNVQAAVLDVKLKHLPGWLEHRRAIAHRYQEALRSLNAVTLPPIDGGGRHDVLQNYVVSTDRRNELRTFLNDRGVETLVSWPKPMWEHSALGLPNPNLPVTERICREVLSLPLSAETTPVHVDATVAVIREFFA